MKTRNGVGLVLVIALLVLANACLDYTAVCKALDVDSLFDGAVTEIASGSEEGQALLVSNIIAIVISLGCAATLWVLPRVGANSFATGARKACFAALGAAAAIALIIAGLRFSSDVANTVLESGEATAVLKGVFLVLVMLALSAGEAIASYYKQLSALKCERAELQALRLRLAADLADVDTRVRAAQELATLAKEEALCACKGADESLYQGLLTLSGEFQNSFIGFSSAIDESRARYEEQLSALARNAQVAPGVVAGAADCASAGKTAANGSPAGASAADVLASEPAVTGTHASPACGQVAA